MFRGKEFSVASGVAWLASLCLPTMIGDDRNVLGFELVVIAAKLMPLAVIFTPAHLAGVLSNLLLLRHLTRIYSGRLRSTAQPAWVAVALLLNFFLGATFGTNGANRGPASLPGLLVLPGFYVWLFSFLLLTMALMRGEPVQNEKATPDVSDRADR